MMACGTKRIPGTSVRPALLFLAAAAIMAACLLGLAGCGGTGGSGEGGAQAPAADGAESEEGFVDAEVVAGADALRIGAMKGPTSIGLANMMQEAQGQFTVVAAADELAALLLQDQVDIALLPTNVAATLYQKTGGAIQVIDVNTLGVLYAVTADAEVGSMDDLRGRTVYMTGKNSIPEYTVRELLAANGLTDSDVDLQFRSEPSEVAALIAQDGQAVGILPEPFVTSATAKDPSLRVAIDLTQAWEKTTDGTQGSFITGVTVAKAATVAEKPEAINEFLRRHKESAALADSDPAAIADEVVALGIIPNAEIALTAIPRCNVVCLAGPEMRDALAGFISVLYDQDPSCIGGEMPLENFYYLGDVLEDEL